MRLEVGCSVGCWMWMFGVRERYNIQKYRTRHCNEPVGPGFHCSHFTFNKCTSDWMESATGLFSAKPLAAGAGSIILILLELFPGRSVTPVCRLWYRGLEALKMRTTAGVELTRVSLITWNACMTKRTGAVSHSTSDFSHGSKTEVD